MVAEEEIRERLSEVGFFKEKKLKNFRKQKLRLSSGGEFEFDAVDGDGKAAVCISTTKGLTHRGNAQSGTKRKIQADVNYLSQTDVDYRVLVFSEKSAHAVFCKEQNKGRISSDIAILHVPLSSEMQKQIDDANKESSIEGRKQ